MNHRIAILALALLAGCGGMRPLATTLSGAKPAAGTGRVQLPARTQLKTTRVHAELVSTRRTARQRAQVRREDPAARHPVPSHDRPHRARGRGPAPATRSARSPVTPRPSRSTPPSADRPRSRRRPPRPRSRRVKTLIDTVQRTGGFPLPAGLAFARSHRQFRVPESVNVAAPLVQLTRSAPSAPQPASCPQAFLAQGQGARRAQLRAHQGPDAGARPPHGLRRGPLPQHRRMLGAQGRDLHDPGRRLHPELRLLRGRPRHAEGLRSARADPPGRGGASAWGWSTWSSRRWIGTTCPMAAPRRSPAASPRSAGACRDTSVEVLIPDFKGSERALRIVMDARPDILNHNLETAERLYRLARPGGRYDRALELLANARRMDARARSPSRASSSAWARSGTRCSVCMRDLRRSDVNILTLGQYLRPSDAHICRWRATTRPDEFAELRDIGLAHGIHPRAGEPAHPLVLPRLGAGALAASASRARRAIRPVIR